VECLLVEAVGLRLLGEDEPIDPLRQITVDEYHRMIDADILSTAAPESLGGGGFGFHLFEVLEGALAGTAGAIDAPLELAEGFGLATGGLTEGEFVVGGPGVLVVERPELGFGGMETALEPLAADEVVEEGAGFGGGGMVVLVVLVDEELEIGEFFGGEDDT